jgi:hypothetical protein
MDFLVASDHLWSEFIGHVHVSSLSKHYCSRNTETLHTSKRLARNAENNRRRWFYPSTIPQCPAYTIYQAAPAA